MNTVIAIDRHVPVLIVGAGLAGLSAATLLAWHGVRCLLVERRASTARHPRARGINPRSLELLRQIPGLEADLAAAGRGGTNDVTIVIAESVTGREFRTLMTPADVSLQALSPAALCTAGQDRVEPILLRHARGLGADIHFSTELVEFTQDASGARATLLEAGTGQTSVVTADYLIAADGNRSRIRSALGIGVHGHGTMSHNMSILFEADLSGVLRGRGFVLYYLQNPDFTGVFVSTDDDNRGQVSVEFDPERERVADYDPDRAARMVRAALGLPDLDVTILDVMAWTMSSKIADRMAEGRVFLAGDAAHTMPPTGGLGGQTAIQDAADLAWKLALVLRRQAGPVMLESYQAERHPVAELTVVRQTANYVERMRPDRSDLPVAGAETDYLSVAMGYRYRSAAIIDDASDDGGRTEDPLHPTGRPGTRRPHRPLELNGRTISTLDLVGHGFVLMCGPEGRAWAEAARALGRQDLPMTIYQLGAELAGDTEGVLASLGLDPDGAVLIRPDGFIAWRQHGAAGDPAAVLGGVLSGVLCRDVLVPESTA
jgi:2-polyprenyl-6-methoxyphenol hydroxylase-like FAD-dependent oxidoreductase